MNNNYIVIDGGVTAPQGFRAAGIHAGIKGKKKDVALLVSDHDCALAGIFTKNRVFAAPVALCRERVARGSARAIVINSGCANACTGEQGMADANEMARLTAEQLGIEANAVCVCSTGTIGLPLPMERIANGIRDAAAALSDDGGTDAATAIMTTDTRRKEAAAECLIDGKTVKIGGMTKGAGMICPDMATMLGFITTDAAVSQPFLQKALARAAAHSFNRISVDGDQSTNDTVLLLANGAAGNIPVDGNHPDAGVFTAALTAVCTALAKAIVLDGEGATKFITVTCRGAKTSGDALAVARAVSNSLLVKTAWFGQDPNWGRVVAAAGYSGAELDQSKLEVYYDDLLVFRNGVPVMQRDLSQLEAVVQKPAFQIIIDLHLGNATETVFTCDCSHEYVNINASYMT